MRVLRISRAHLELARVHLTRATTTIGRSPSCEVVLRAPGVKAIHFLLEWMGTGEFDPEHGDWSIFDVSSVNNSAEGVLLTESETYFGDFSFQWVEDSFAASPKIGGSIQSELTYSQPIRNPFGGKAPEKLVELVQIRTDSGAVEEVCHLPMTSIRKKTSALDRTPQFKIQLGKSGREQAIKVLLQEMPGAKVYSRGRKIEPSPAECPVTEADLVQVRWKEHSFYIRFVAKTATPKIRQGFTRDPFLMKLALIGLGLVGVVTAIYYQSQKTEAPEPTPPPRFARVEVKVEPPPPPPPKPVQPQVPKETKVGLKVPTPNKTPAKAAAPRFKSAPGPVRMGLNSPAKPADVNAVGILGALNKTSAPKGAGVRADRILNDGIVTQSVSGETGAVVIKNPAGGVLGTGKSGGGNGQTDLTQAGTTLRGGNGFDPKSVGPIARKGGTSDYSVGSSLSGAGKGVGFGLDIGQMDSGGFQVSGGARS